MTSLRHHPAVKRTRRRLAIVRSTGRWRPSKIALAASGNMIHVDTDDVRGWEIIRGLGRGHQPALIDLWRRAIDALDPTLALDVGANYGEMILSGSYPTGCRAIAVEPNPQVADLLRQSLAEHPDRDRIELHECLASDEGSGTATLHVDPRWSGSASVALEAEGMVGIEVPVHRIDDLVGDVMSASRLLVKIDAEGWEAQVVAGMASTLGGAGSLVAIIEFDPDHLRRAHTSPTVLFTQLASLGSCWSVAYDGTLSAASHAPNEATDLLIVSDEAIAEALGAPASITP